MSSRSPTTASPGRTTPGRLGDAALGFLIAVVLSSFAVTFLLAVDPDADEGAAGLVVASIALWGGFVGMPVWVSRHRGSGDVRSDFALRARWTDAVWAVPLGVATQLLVLPAIYWLLGRFFDVSALSEPAEETLSRGSGIGLVAILLVVGIGAPIAEELFFRGLFQGAAVARLGNSAGVLVVAAVFGATHLQPLQFPGLFAAGLIFGLLTLRSGRLGPAVFAHIGFNTAAAVVLIWG